MKQGEAIAKKKHEANPFKNFFCEIRAHWKVYIMALPGLTFFAIFSYYPLIWLQIAFKDFNVMDGIWNSPWNGIKNFEFFFKSQYFPRITFNTLWINFWNILVGTVLAVTLAILLDQLRSKFAKKAYQSALFLPYFLSWIVIGAFLYNLLGESYGTVNSALKLFGLQPVGWYSDANLWVPILVIVNTWQSLGYSMIIYLSAITGIDSELYEAAKIDGASRFQQIKSITIPLLVPTIIILTLISVGRIFYGNFGMIYALVGDNGLLYKTTDVIDTYVFRAMRSNGSYGMATAVTIYQSVLGFIVVIIANKLARRYDKDTALF